MGRANNFDGLRLAAALSVIVGHAFVLLGFPAPRVAGVPLHSLGVAVFFSVSGFLIAGSSERSRDLSRFLWHRVVRIFPALLVLVGVTVLVIGPVATTADPGAYFASPETWQYLLNAMLLAQYDLPGVFQSAAHVRTSVNGSLWTLGVEFCCYLGVAAVWFAPPRARGVLYIACFAILVFIGSTEGPVGAAADLCAFFAAAAALRTFMPEQWLVWPLAVAAGLAIAVTAGSSMQHIALWIALPVLVVIAGSNSTPIVRRAARRGDYSYGLYLWAYPVQQIVLDLVGPLPMLLNLALVTAATGTIAVGSWWFIERPALGLKSLALPIAVTR